MMAMIITGKHKARLLAEMAEGRGQRFKENRVGIK
jgi:hypothetical protein